jgi:hypothetical protein
MPPSPKNLSKNGLPQKGGSLFVEGVFAKKFSVWEKIPLSALPFGRSHTLVAEGFKEPSTVA